MFDQYILVFFMKACHLPALNNLKQLKLDCSMHGRCVNTCVLEVLLKRSPNLEDLVLEDASKMCLFLCFVIPILMKI